MNRGAFLILIGLMGVTSSVSVAPGDAGHALDSSATPSRSAPPGFLRVVETSTDPWRVSCEATTCGEYALFSTTVPLPADTAHFDVVVTVTMDYRLSRGDWGQLHVFYCPVDTPPVPCPISFLPPGTFPVSWTPGPTGTTVTMAWGLNGLETAGWEGYHYQLMATAYDAGDKMIAASGSKMTAVFEMWPSS